MGQKISDLKGAVLTMEDENGIATRTEVSKESDGCDQTNAVKDSDNSDSENTLQNSKELNLSLSSTVSSGASGSEEAEAASKPKEWPAVKKVSSHRRNATKTLSIVCGKSSHSKSLQTSKEIEKSKKKRNHWVLRFNCPLLKSSSGSDSASSSTYNTYIPEASTSDSCTCTGYRQTGEPTGANAIYEAAPSSSKSEDSSEDKTERGNASDCEAPAEPVIDLSKFNPDDYPIEDCDEQARRIRAREMAEGIEPPPGFQVPQRILLFPSDFDIDNLTALFQTHLGIYHRNMSGLPPWDILPMITAPMLPQRAHTQIDYIHYLVPDLLEITSSSFYWGKMDRYEAERLLEGRPEGTFLLRDSAQEEYLFSVSFRRYGRSLHARIEEWNHQVSFDSHDPGVFTASTVCGLIDHYKDPSCCMFFEPVLTNPLHRQTPFSLQHLCRAVVTSRSTYDGINKLFLPKTLKNYLKEYHYKQRVCVRRLDQ